METKTMRIRLTFIDDVLGTAAGDEQIHETYIASKAPDAPSREEEVAAVGVDEVVEKDKTIFPKNENGEPILWGYQVKGCMKSACQALRQIKGTESSKLKAFKKQIDLRIFVYPDASDKGGRAIVIHTDDEIGDCQRPLRASTAQGERTALADSEKLSKGARCEFDIFLLNPDDETIVKEWLDYGELNGIGQWRNSGKGAFLWDELDADGNVIDGNHERIA